MLRHLLVLLLRSHRQSAGLVVLLKLRGAGHRLHALRTVECHTAAPVVVYNPVIVDVVDGAGIDVVDRAVVVEVVTAPVAALVTLAAVAVAVVDATVVANVTAPVAAEKQIAARARGPVTGGPQSAFIGSAHPDARNPVVAGRLIVPVSGGPDVTVAGAGGLLILWQLGRWSRRCCSRRFAGLQLLWLIGGLGNTRALGRSARVGRGGGGWRGGVIRAIGQIRCGRILCGVNSARIAGLFVAACNGDHHNGGEHGGASYLRQIFH